MLPARVEHVHYDRAGVARQFEVHAFPILDSEGRVTRVIEHNVDVTERKRAQQALVKSEERYRSLVAQSPDGILIYDPVTLQIQEGNQAIFDMLGYSEEELLRREQEGGGRPLSEILADLSRRN